MNGKGTEGGERDGGRDTAVSEIFQFLRDTKVTDFLFGLFLLKI